MTTKPGFRAGNQPGLTLFRSVPSIGTELQRAAVSVSQCGYNTVMEILSTGVRALVVPFASINGNEQDNRARRLQRLGVLEVLQQDRLSGPARSVSCCAPGQRLHAWISTAPRGARNGFGTWPQRLKRLGWQTLDLLRDSHYERLVGSVARGSRAGFSTGVLLHSG